MYESISIQKIAARIAYENGQITFKKYHEILNEVKESELKEQAKREQTERLIREAKSNFKHNYSGKYTHV